MKKKKLPTILLFFGFLGTIGYLQQKEIVSAVICICIVGAGLCLRKKNKVQEQQQVGEITSKSKPITTFSCESVGFRFPCRFPNARFTDRNTLLYKCKVGDDLTLKEYEWEGKIAYALIHNKFGADIGTIPATHVRKIAALLSQYNAETTIISLQEINYKNEFYQKAEVQICFYEKQTATDTPLKPSQ